MNQSFSTLKLPDRFYEDYWQQKPCCIRQGLTKWPLISAETLFELAAKPAIESRVIHQPQPDHWRVENGPFQQRQFPKKTLSSQAKTTHKNIRAGKITTPWSLLIQGFDQHHPQAFALTQSLPNIPQWRIDDVMVSYSQDQGSVGPHADQYDVFLVQGEGQKHWQLGPKITNDTDYLEDSELSLVADFEILFDEILNPGDILYIPPQWIHYGRAIGESFTYSIGFRAPSYAELFDSLAYTITAAFSEQQRLEDRSTKTCHSKKQHALYSSALIEPETIDQLYKDFIHTITPERVAQALGTELTRPKQEMHATEHFHLQDCTQNNEDHVSDQNILYLMRNPHSRMAYCLIDQGLQWFVDGEVYQLAFEDKKIIEAITAFEKIPLISDHRSKALEEVLEILTELDHLLKI